MSVKYCVSCGAKHEFAFAAPNFCSQCGSSLGTTSSAKQTIKQTVKQRPSSQSQSIEDDDEGYSDADEVPHLDGIDVDIEIEAPNTFVFAKSENGGLTIQPAKVPKRVLDADKQRRGSDNS